jgi:hypothetical protein
MANKNYFNEEEFQEQLKKYQQSAVVRDGVAVQKDERVEAYLVTEVTKIVNAIIMVYRYYIFEDYEDLRQHALQACYTNFLKFNPKKGTCFNYFSLISKMSLLNYTSRRQRHRNHSDIDEQLDLNASKEVNYEIFFEELEITLFNIIDENYVGEQRKKYIKVATLIIEYFRKTRKFISKSDLYSWIRSFGIKNNVVREFIKEMSQYNTKIFSIIEGD